MLTVVEFIKFLGTMISMVLFTIWLTTIPWLNEDYDGS